MDSNFIFFAVDVKAFYSIISSRRFICFLFFFPIFIALYISFPFPILSDITVASPCFSSISSSFTFIPSLLFFFLFFSILFLFFLFPLLSILFYSISSFLLQLMYVHMSPYSSVFFCKLATSAGRPMCSRKSTAIFEKPFGSVMWGKWPPGRLWRKK